MGKQLHPIYNNYSVTEWIYGIEYPNDCFHCVCSILATPGVGADITYGNEKSDGTIVPIKNQVQLCCAGGSNYYAFAISIGY